MSNNNTGLYPPIQMPKISVGVCKNSRNCKEYATDLAEGWCVNCWDRGNPKKSGENKTSKVLSLIVPGSERIETRGRHTKNCACEYHTSKGFA